jgi:hypothetical protein
MYRYLLQEQYSLRRKEGDTKARQEISGMRSLYCFLTQCTYGTTATATKGRALGSLPGSSRYSTSRSSPTDLAHNIIYVNVTLVAGLNPMASTLPQRMLPPVTLADSRWDSSRSLFDNPPKAPAAEEDETIDTSIVSGMNEWSPEDSSWEEVASVSPRYQETMVAGQALSPSALNTSEETKPHSTASSQGIPAEITTVCPPQVVTTMVPQPPRMRLSEKAVSVRCLLMSPGAGIYPAPPEEEDESC